MTRVRIGFLHQRDEILLRLPAGSRIQGESARPAAGEWRILVGRGRPGLVREALKILESADRALVSACAARLRDAGLPATVRPHAPGGSWGTARVLPTQLLSLVLGDPSTAGDAEHMRRELGGPADQAVLADAQDALGDLAGSFSPGLPALWHLGAPVRCHWEERPAEGRLRLQGPDGRMLDLPAPLRLELPPGKAAYVSDVRVGIGFHWDRHETLSYEDTIEAWIDPGARLGLINELELERYLASVNSSEMTVDSPPDLLRAQTVAARSTLIATRGRHHAGEPFDICADDHCQCFRGCGAIRPASLEAARATAGTVLAHDGRVCDARYSKSCGGIVEAYEHVWEDQPVAYLPSFRDTCAPDPGFTAPATEEGWRAWILGAEPVWCNTEEFRLPPGLAYSDGFYRWRVEMPREEAADHIRRATGRGFGRLVDLVPLRRGASGRLVRLLVRTDAGEFTLGKELAIRLALSPTCLYSAAFVWDWEGDRLVIHGKGWGHGVGMCQLGATRMALDGRDWRMILAHYYPGTQLVTL